MANHLAWEPEGLVHRFSGVLTGSELMSAIETAHADPRFDDVKFAIADFTACSDVLVTDEEAAILSAITGIAAQNRRRRTRSAVVVSDPRFFAYFDHFIESPLSPAGTRRFATLEEAKQWAMAR